MTEMSPNWALQSFTIWWSFSPGPGISLIISKKGIHNRPPIFKGERLIYVSKKRILLNYHKSSKGKMSVDGFNSYFLSKSRGRSHRLQSSLVMILLPCIRVVSTLHKHVFPSQFGPVLLHSWSVTHLIVACCQASLSSKAAFIRVHTKSHTDLRSRLINRNYHLNASSACCCGAANQSVKYTPGRHGSGWQKQGKQEGIPFQPVMASRGFPLTFPWHGLGLSPSYTVTPTGWQ